MPSEKSRFIQRCVADVTAQGKELKGAFAICTAQSQKAGYSKPGSAKMTGKGAAREKAFKNADDMQAKSAEYERAVQAGRQEEISMRSLIRQLEEAKKASEADTQLAKDAGVPVAMYRAARKVADEVKVDWDAEDRKRYKSVAPKNPSENSARFRALSAHPTVQSYAKGNSDTANRLRQYQETMKAGKFGEASLVLDLIERGTNLASTRGAGNADEMLLRIKQGDLTRTLNYAWDMPKGFTGSKWAAQEIRDKKNAGGGGGGAAPSKQRPSWDEAAKKAAETDAAEKKQNAGDFKATSDGKAEVPGPEGQVDGEWRTVRGKRVFFPSDPGDEVPEGPWGGAPWRPGWDKQGRFREPKTDRPQKGQLSLFGKHESMESLFQSIEEGVDEEAGAAKAIADEILRQLGGRRFLVMTGARNLMSFDKLDDERKWPGLQVQFPQGKAKYMRIALAPSDTYTIQFMTRTGKVAKEMDDIYVDVLQRVVSDYTGLALSL